MSNLARSRGGKLSNVHIVQWIECSQMLTKIFQVEEKILSVRHFQLPTILPLKEIFEAICPKRWRGQVSEQEVSHAGQPRPPVNGLLRFTYAFLFFFNILFKVQYKSTHCIYSFSFLSICLCNFCIVSVLIQLIWVRSACVLSCLGWGPSSVRIAPSSKTVPDPQLFCICIWGTEARQRSKREKQKQWQ